MLLNCGVGEDSWVPRTARRSNQSILKEISPEYSLEGLMLKLKLQYFGHLMRRTDIGKDPDAGKDWRLEEKAMAEDEMVGCHHWLNGHEFDQAPGIGDGQGVLACCSPWGRKELDMTEQLNWTELNQCRKLKDSNFTPGLGRCLGEGHGNPLEYSCLENPIDREAWQAMVHRVSKSQTWLKRSGIHAHTCTHTPPAPSSTMSFLDFLNIYFSFSLSLSLSHAHIQFPLSSNSLLTYINEVKMLVTQSCPTLYNPKDHSASGSSVHGMF